MAEERHVKIVASVEGGPTIERTFRGSAEAVDEMEAAAASASVGLERLEEAGAEAGQGVRRQAEGAEEALQDLASGASNAGASLEKAGDRGVQSMRQVSEASEGASRSGGGFNQMLFTAGDAAQDAQYGIAGVANNIGQLVEQASYAQGGLQGFVSALVGMGGVVFAVQILLAYGDDIVAFFSNGADEAERMSEVVEEVTGDLVKLQAELDAVEFSVQGEDQIRAYRDRIEGAREEQQAFVEALDATTSWSGANLLWRGYDDAATKAEQAAALVRELGVSQEVAAGAVEGHANSQAKVKAAIEEAGVSLEQEGRNLEYLASESEAATTKLDTLQFRQEAQEAAAAEGAKATQDYVKAIGMVGDDEAVAKAEEGLAALQESMQARGFSQAERLAGEVEYLEGAIGALREETDVPMDSAAVDSLREALASARAEQEEVRAARDDAQRATEKRLKRMKERAVAQEEQRRQLQLEVVQGGIERERTALEQWREEQIALAEGNADNRLLVEERYQQRKAALQEREANAEKERQRVIDALRVAAMEEGEEKRLAQIDQQIDAQVERYRQQYEERLPEAFGRIEELLEEQRARLREKAKSAEPLFELEEDFEVDLAEQSIRAVDAALANLQQQFDNATTQRQRDEIQAVIDKLREMRSEMQATGEDSIALGRTLEQGLASAIARAAQAVGEGGNMAKAIMLTLTDLAQRVGQMLIGFGTSMIALQAIVSNPVGAIIAGGALIALASAARSAISGAFDDTTDRREQRQERIPGFADGVTGYEGGVALVGEEGPELVTMGRGSNVITNENTRALLGAVGQMLTPASGGGFGGSGARALIEEMRLTRQAFENKQFRLRGNDLETQSARTAAINADAGIK